MKESGRRTSWVLLCVFTLVGAAFLFILALPARSETILTPDLSSGQPVGTKIVWTATDTDAEAMTQYRFTIQYPGGRQLIVRDFDIYNYFDWVPLAEGIYQVSVFVRDLLGVRSATESYYVNSKVTGEDAVISETQHPLVALYSVPP